MNIIFNSLLESFNNIELPEISEESAWYNAMGTTLLLGAGLVYAIYKRSNSHHTLTVTYPDVTTHPSIKRLKIQVSGDRNTLPETLKKQLLEQIQDWTGPQGYRFYSSRGIQVLPKNLHNLTALANATTAHPLIRNCHIFSNLKDDFYLNRLNPQEIEGGCAFTINNLQKIYSFEVIADDKSPPEILDGVLQDIINFFKADVKQ